MLAESDAFVAIQFALGEEIEVKILLVDPE